MKKLFYFAVLLFLVSCSNPLDRKFSKETTEEDLKEIKKKVSQSDLESLGLYLVQSAFTGEDLT